MRTAAISTLLFTAFITGILTGRQCTSPSKQHPTNTKIIADTVMVLDTVIEVKPETVVFWKHVRDTLKVQDTVVLNDTTRLGDIPIMQISQMAQMGLCEALAIVEHRGQIYRFDVDIFQKPVKDRSLQWFFGGLVSGMVLWEVIR